MANKVHFLAYPASARIQLSRRSWRKTSLFSSAAAWVDVSVSRFIESKSRLDSIGRRLAEYRRVVVQRPSLRVDSKMPVLGMRIWPSGFALAGKRSAMPSSSSM
jgi:hypothetical protein